MFGSRRAKIISGIAAALVLLVVGYTVGSLTTRPPVPGNDSVEAGFARDMSEHHGQAVELGMIAYQNATTPEVRTLAGDIAITQQGQIGMMQTWLKEWGLGPNTDKPAMAWMPEGQRALNGNLMPGMATREEIAKLKAATGKDVDILFCQYMLRHHLGGLHMIDGLLSQNPNAEVRDLGEIMKKGQSAEIPTMKALLTSLGAEPLG